VDQRLTVEAVERRVEVLVKKEEQVGVVPNTNASKDRGDDTALFIMESNIQSGLSM
jgi:hypothetical protein